MYKQHKKRGFTLVELSIVLLFTGMLFSGVWVAFEGVLSKAHIDESVAQVWRITDNFRSMYAGISPSNNPDRATLITTGVYPNDVVDGTKLYHAWSGGSFDDAIEITYPNGAGDIKKFQIEFNYVPQKSCIQFLQGIPPTGQNGAPTDVFFKRNAVLSASMKGASIPSMTSFVSAGCTGVAFQFDL